MNNLKKDREFQITTIREKKNLVITLIFFRRNDDNLKRCGFVVSKKTRKCRL